MLLGCSAQYGMCAEAFSLGPLTQSSPLLTLTHPWSLESSEAASPSSSLTFTSRVCTSRGVFLVGNKYYTALKCSSGF